MDENATVHFSGRMSIESRARLKAIALLQRTSMAKVLDRAITKEWERLGDTVASQSMSSKLTKEIRNILSKINIS